MKRNVRVSAATVCKVGTLAAFGEFIRRDFVANVGTSRVLDELVRRGLVKPSGAIGYYPTVRGWNAIKKSCRLKR